VKRVLLIGGSGQLGTAIRRRWTDCEVVAPPHAELAIEHSGRLRDALRKIGPDALVNAAAFHDVDRCETEPARAFEVNAVAVREAARAARDADVAFVTFSTDYVFDGATESPYVESDAPHPLSVYGASKLAGEYLVESLRSRALVVRSCGVYGPGASLARGRPFIERLLSHERTAGPVRVVDDVYASPTFAGDLADAVRGLIDRGANGLYHAVDDGPVSWFDFAVEAVRQAGVDVALEPIPAREWKAAALRPQFSALSSAKLASQGIAMPSWRSGIAAYLRSLGSSPDRSLR
jgi:dTDP-4-dehydrorhamnose reductase